MIKPKWKNIYFNFIMLGICPMAGVGGQLHPITITKPKAMMKVAGKRIIDHLLEKFCEAFPQNRKIVIILGYKKKTLASYITDKYSSLIDIIYKEQIPLEYKQDIPYFSGLGDAISLAGPFGKDDDCFIFLSDMLPVEGFSPLVETLNRNNWDGIINVSRNPFPMHYGVCLINNENLIEKVIEKPKSPPSDLVISGSYYFSKKITRKLFDYLDLQAKEPIQANKIHQLTPIIQNMIDDGAKIGVHLMEKPLLDFGRFSTLLEGNRYLLSTHPSINENYTPLLKKGKIVNTTIVPPVYIGKNCTISNCVLGPNVSLGDNIVLNKCVLSDVIVGDCSTLENIITEKSIIGDFVVLDSLIKNQISIGDSSTLSTAENFEMEK